MFALFSLSMSPLDIIVHFISDHLPWVGAHPAIAALLIVGSPIGLFVLAEYWLSRYMRKNRVP